MQTTVQSVRLIAATSLVPTDVRRMRTDEVQTVPVPMPFGHPHLAQMLGLCRCQLVERIGVAPAPGLGVEVLDGLEVRPVNDDQRPLHAGQYRARDRGVDAGTLHVQSKITEQTCQRL